MSEELEAAQTPDEGESSVKAKKPFYKSSLFLAGLSSLLILGGILFCTQEVWKRWLGFSSNTSSLSQAQREVLAKLTYFEMSNLVVNLRQTQKAKKPTYLKLSLLVELNAANEMEMLNVLRPKIVDQFQVYLRELTVEDLSAAEGGLQRLREELLIRVNSVTSPLKVKNLLFKDVLIQ